LGCVLCFCDMKKTLLAPLCFAIGLAAWGLAMPVRAEGPARLVADLAQGSVQVSQPGFGFASVGNRSVFLRADNEYGPALWVTDGTVQGTSLLGILCPPCGSAVPLGSTGSVAFYRVSQGSPSLEMRIWRTDGTPAGTFPLTESFALPSGLPGPLSSLAGGRLFFTACTPGLGCELWSSDGSPVGTGPAGILPGNTRELAATGEQAFLIAGPSGGPSGLWLANGTGLKLLREFAQAAHLPASGGGAFFIAEDAQGGGLEIWTSDGTAAGTRPVTHFEPQNPFRHVPLLKAIDGRLYFVVDEYGHGVELWSVGAEPDSVRRLTDFADPGAIVGSIEKAGDRIVFAASQRGEGFKLWSSRGALRTTSPLAGCLSGGCPGVLGPMAIIGKNQIGNRTVFYGRNRAGDGFWVSDGTSAGTRLLKRSERSHDEVQLAAAGGRVLFDVTNEYEVGELWITDGTSAGTFFVAHGGPHWSHYYEWAGTIAAGAAGGHLLFPAGETEAAAYEVLWSNDGSPGGSRPLYGALAARGSYPTKLVPFRDGLLAQSCNATEEELRFIRGTETTRLLALPVEHCNFVGLKPVALGSVAVFPIYRDDGISLWRTDGTAAGTTVLVPAAGPVEPEDVTRFGDLAAFWLALLGPNGGVQAQLWTTDGTVAGMRKVFEPPPNVEMYGLKAIGGKFYFLDAERRGDDSAFRPWVSDGTLGGTHPLIEAAGLRVLPFGSLTFTELGGRVFFPVAIGEGPVEIWSTDGTPAGTGPAITAVSGVVGLEAIGPETLSVVGGRLYFAARWAGDPTGRLLPWVSDGTDEGTEPLASIALRDESFTREDRSRFTELGGRVFFAASDATHGDELWATDGTPGGTAQVRDIASGRLGSYPRGLVVWRGRLYFRARDKAHGMELWTSDGTAKGTRLVQDIATGPAWSAPLELTATGEGLYFSANDGVHGRELWELPVSGLDGEP